MAVYKAQYLMTVYRVLGLGWGGGKARKAQGSGASHLASTFFPNTAQVSLPRECEAKDGLGHYQSEKDRAGGAKGVPTGPPSLRDTSPQITQKAMNCSSNILKVQTHGSR